VLRMDMRAPKMAARMTERIRRERRGIRIILLPNAHRQMSKVEWIKSAR
jgi:hypothetical protein